MRGSRLAVLVLAGLPALAAGAEPQFPAPRGRINDFAKLLDATVEGRIREAADALARDTGVELIVVTVFHAGKRTPQQFAEALFEQWGLGQPGKDKCLLLLLLKREKSLETDAGPGLEAILPDYARMEALLGEPRVKLEQGKLAEALIAAAGELAERLRQGQRALAIAVEEQLAAELAQDGEEPADIASEIPRSPESPAMTGLQRGLRGLSWMLVLATALAALGFQLRYRLQEVIPDRDFLGAGLAAAAIPAILYGLGTVSGWAWLFSGGMAASTAALGLSLWNHRCPQCELWMDISSQRLSHAASPDPLRSATTYDCRFCGYQSVKAAKRPPARQSRPASPRPDPKESRFKLSPEASIPSRSSGRPGPARPWVPPGASRSLRG